MSNAVLLSAICIAVCPHIGLSLISSHYRYAGTSSRSTPLQASRLSEVSIGGGIAGIAILLGNRLLNMDIAVSDIQSRADIICMVACSGLLLNAFSDQDITARDRDPVALLGYALREPLLAPGVDTNLGATMKWLSFALIKNTPATSVHIIRGDQILCQMGVVSADPSKGAVALKARSPILSSVLGEQQEVYLPDLQILPGKIEFSYLPLNAQSVMILPAADMAVVVATNQAKVLKQSDLSRIRILVSFLAQK